MIHPELYACLSMAQKRIIGIAIVAIVLVIIVLKKVAKIKLKEGRNLKKSSLRKNNIKYDLEFIIDSKNKTLQEIQEERAKMIKYIKESGYYV